MTQTILIIEDHPEVREPMSRLLRIEGYRALPAANGSAAMALLQSETVDLVLLDLMMPKMDGIAFLEAVRADPRWQGLPVLVLTGLIEGSSITRARELNVTDVLPKARFTVDELLARIRGCLTAQPNGALPPVEAVS